MDAKTSTAQSLCPCGALLLTFTYDGSRAILNRKRDVCEAPVTLTCLNGHTRELWMTHEDAQAYFDFTTVMAR